MTSTFSESGLQEKELMASLADFTARLYLNEPSRESCNSFHQWGKLLANLFPESTLTTVLFSVDQDKSEAYRQEFFDLFLVPVSGVYHPPFKGLSSDGSTATGLCSTLDNLYQEAGFNRETLRQASYFRKIGRSDHLGVELAFYANLLYSSTKVDTVSEAELLDETASRFFQHYLGQWAGSYGSILKENATGSYFKSLGAITILIQDIISAAENLT